MCIVVITRREKPSRRLRTKAMTKLSKRLKTKFMTKLKIILVGCVVVFVLKMMGLTYILIQFGVLTLITGLIMGGIILLLKAAR